VQVFGDTKLTAALLGRVTHHWDIIKTAKHSYRFKHQKSGIKTDQPTKPYANFWTLTSEKLPTLIDKSASE